MELWAIIPELTLACGFLVLLAAAPFFEGKRAAILHLVGLFVLAAAAILTVRMLSWPDQRVFHGTYILDPVTHLFKFYAIASAGLMLLVCAEYFRGSRFHSDVPALVVVSALAAAMMAGSADIGLVVLFFYTLTVSTLILIALLKENPRSNEAALKYFLFGAVATAVMLYGLSLLYGIVGRTDITISAAGVPALAILAFLIALVGFGFKMAAVPFHMWAPDVYEGAPTPVAGFISVLPKAVAFVVVLRLATGALSSLQPIWQMVVAVLAAATMTVGNIWALRQTSVKRMLAYSSIAQIGYVLVGLVAVRNGGGGAALLYLITYLFMNLGAFFAVGRMDAVGEKNEIVVYSGLFRRAPALALLLTLFLLSLAGVPPLAGFIGKVLILRAAIDAGFGWLAVVMAVNVVIAAYYYLRIIGSMYLHESKGGRLQSSRWTDVAIAVCGLATIMVGVLPQPFVAFAFRAWQ